MSTALFIYLIGAGFLLLIGVLNYLFSTDSAQRVWGSRVFFIGPVWPLAVLAGTVYVVYLVVRGLCRMFMVAIKGEV